MAVTWVEKDTLFSATIARLQQPKILLDIGCGIQPSRLVRPEIHVCCEPFMQYVARLQELVPLEPDRNFLVLNATWDQAVKLFPPKSVDTVILQDVIEHLEKDDALRLLKATEQLASRQIAVFTPLGFMPQHHPDGKDAWGLDGGHWQEHRSGWQPEDFDESWDVLVTKEFHFTDSLGNKLETPFGALWAIKTFPCSQTRSGQQRTNRQRIYAAVDKVLNVVWKLNGILKGKA